MRPPKSECVRLDVYGSFWKFQEVLQSCNMLQLTVERHRYIYPVCRCMLTILSGKILCKCDASSSIVAHIAISDTLK